MGKWRVRAGGRPSYLPAADFTKHRVLESDCGYGSFLSAWPGLECVCRPRQCLRQDDVLMRSNFLSGPPYNHDELNAAQNPEPRSLMLSSYGNLNTWLPNYIAVAWELGFEITADDSVILF
jgi:hypothetical protein